MPPVYHNQFPTADPGPRRLAFVGEALGSTELARGLPFQGAAGQLLNAQLAKVGILRAQVFVGNVAAVQPVRNEFETLDWAGAEVQDGIAALLTDLAAYRPTLVVTLGNVPLHLFHVGNVCPPRRKRGSKSVYDWPRKIKAWRGSLFLSSELTTAHLWISDDAETARAFDLPALVTCAGEDKPTESEGVRMITPFPTPPAGAVPLSGEPARASNGATISDGNGTAAPSASTPTAMTAPDHLVTCSGTAAVTRWKCLATLHPAYLLRSPADLFDLQNDLRRASVESRTAELNLPTLDFDYGPR